MDRVESFMLIFLLPKQTNFEVPDVRNDLMAKVAKSFLLIRRIKLYWEVEERKENEIEKQYRRNYELSGTHCMMNEAEGRGRKETSRIP
jgi:hypothetical protein